MLPSLRALSEQITSAPAHQSFDASLGDLLAALALFVAWITYRQARYASIDSDVKAATARLQALRDRFLIDIAGPYFSTSYDGDAAAQRAENGRGHPELTYRISEEPLVA